MHLYCFVAVSCLTGLITVGHIITDGSTGHATTRPRSPGYVSPRTCNGCHQQQFSSWKDSHHSWAMRKAIADNVLGDFNNATFLHKGVRSKFHKREGQYFVETTGADGKLQDFEIRYTVGVEPLQQYLVELEGGRLQALDLAWDTKRKRWFHLYPDQTAEADDGLHWSGPYKSWNARCAECHQTDFKKNYSAKRKTYASTWSELAVGCQSCHGAGEAHLAWAKEVGSFNADAWRGIDTKGLLAELQGASQTSELNLCSKCHSRRSQFGANSPASTADFNDHYRLALLRDGLYHSDGQINDEVYVYGSFLQSKMHQRGVRCTNCHEPHSGSLVADGNAVCTQCHNPSGRDELPTLTRKLYDSISHHFHKSGGAGAQCVSCHMAEKIYMIVDPRRDHSFRVPRPDLSVAIGTPNACNACHSDKSTKWAADTVERWYPAGQSNTPHFGEIFHGNRQRSTDNTRRALLDLASKTSKPAIVRASALAELQSRLDAQALSQVQTLLADKEPLVRAAATAAMRRAPAVARHQWLLPLLSDPKRVVRNAAALAIVDLRLEPNGKSELATVEAARRDLKTSLSALSDFPETHLQIGGIALTRRNPRAADAAFSEALRQDPQLVDAWLMRSRIAMALRQPRKAIQVLNRGVQSNPKSAPLHRAFGRVQLRVGENHGAIKSLSTAHSIDRNLSGIAIELARANFIAGRYPQVLKVLEDTPQTERASPLALELKALSLARLGDFGLAAETVRELATRYPTQRLSPQLGILLNYGR